tara:strand:- start:1450 stop:1938 length:489 start_codon:yes stop_codon:yes gene_type:complete
MKKNKQFKGFTILEALISLMLMSIIIGITYSLFNLVEKQLSFFKKDNAQILEYNLLNATILGDIDASNTFKVAENTLILKNYNDTEVSYTLLSHSVLRQKDIKIDTFKVRVIDYDVLNNDTKNSQNTIFKIRLNVLNDTINTQYFLKKNNSEIINNLYFNED